MSTGARDPCRKGVYPRTPHSLRTPMSHVADPFENFRSQRQQDGSRNRPRTDRAVYAGRIAELLDSVEERRESRTREAKPLVPEKAELLALIEHAYAVHSNSRAQESEQIAAFLNQIAFEGIRLLQTRDSLVASPLEVDMNFNDLFEFMLNPDAHSLRPRVVAS